MSLVKCKLIRCVFWKCLFLLWEKSHVCFRIYYTPDSISLLRRISKKSQDQMAYPQSQRLCLPRFFTELGAMLKIIAGILATILSLSQLRTAFGECALESEIAQAFHASKMKIEINIWGDLAHSCNPMGHYSAISMILLFTTSLRLGCCGMGSISVVNSRGNAHGLYYWAYSSMLYLGWRLHWEICSLARS